MDITPAVYKDTNIITGYTSKGIKINNILINENIILTSNNIIKWEIALEIFSEKTYQIIINEVKEIKNVIFLIGTGEKFILPPNTLVRFLKLQNINAEFMNTLDACRTYNILVTEQRPVYAFIKI